MERWAGSTIPRYGSLGTIGILTSDVNMLFAEVERHEGSKQVNANSDEMYQKLVRLAQAEAELAKQREGLISSGAAPDYISNLKSEAWHRILIVGRSYLPYQRKTNSGGKICVSAVKRWKLIPKAAPWYFLCYRCLASERANAMRAQGAD